MGKVLIIAVLIVALIVFAPLATIAAINTVFGVAIPYTFWTWLSVLWLQSIFTVYKTK